MTTHDETASLIQERFVDHEGLDGIAGIVRTYEAVVSAAKENMQYLTDLYQRKREQEQDGKDGNSNGA